MADLRSIFGGAYTPPINNEPDPPEAQFLKAIADRGLDTPDRIILDGNIHRFNTGTNGKTDKGKTGWYIGYSDGVPSGAFGCWRSGMEHQWRADIGREITMAEQLANSRRFAEAKRMRDEAKAKLQEVVAGVVDQIWSGCIGAEATHPYLVRKGIKPNGSRVTGDGRLVVPIYTDGILSSLQYITDSDNPEDRKKNYHLDGAVKGSWVIGSVIDARTIYIAEGFATAASIHEATQNPCYVAYNDKNMPAVAKMLREQHGEAQDICIVGDHDTYTEVERQNNHKKGFEWAEQAATEARARVIHIPYEKMDANDYAQAGHDLKALLEPPFSDWLIPADDFCSQPAPIRWLVKHWLQDQALIMVHGPSGGGKTFVVLDWCMTMAAGIPQWNGHNARQGAVVYLAGEGHHGLRSRVAAWKQHNQAGPLNMWLSRDGCDLNTPEGYRRVADSIRGLDELPSLIVVDTLHRFLKGDENSAQDAKTMLDACNSLMREFGCSVLLVHHTGVSDEAQHRARGSSAWKGALDIEISIVPSKGDGPLQIVQRKSKDAEITHPIHAELISVPIKGWLDEDGEPVTSAVVMVCDAPHEHKKDSKEHTFIKTLENQWWASGAEVRENYPYISRSALTDLLIQSGRAKRTVMNDLNPSYCDKLIGALIQAEMITTYEHGWMVVCPVNSAAMMMRKNER